MTEPLAAFGNSKDSPNTNNSRSVSLTILDANGREIPVTTNGNETIEIRIPRDPNLPISSFNRENVTAMNDTTHHLLFNLHYVNITSQLPISFHLEMQPLNRSLAYLFIYRFDQSPQLNSSISLIDGWTIFCPSSKFLPFSLQSERKFVSCRFDQRYDLSILSRQSTNYQSPIVDLWSERIELE